MKVICRYDKKIDLINTDFHPLISGIITFNINYLLITYYQSLHMYFSVSLNTMIIKDT